MLNLKGNYTLKQARDVAFTRANLYEESQMIIPLIISGPYAKRTSYKYDVISFTEWLEQCKWLGSPLAYKEIVRF